MKVAIVVFNSFVNDSRVFKESSTLANKGYEVEVIAHLDKDLPKQELKDNFKVKRFSYLNRKKTKGILGKLISYLIFLYSSTIYCRTFDYIHCNDLNTLPIGLIIKLFFNKKVKIIYDAHEYQTETQGLSGRKKELVRFLEKKMINHADEVIVVSNSIAEEYVKLYNIDKPKVVLNTPFYKDVKKKNLFREKFQLKQENEIFLYQGGLGPGRGIEILLKAFKEITDKNNVIIFMGYGALENLVKSESEKHDNIFFHPAVSPTILLDYTSSADFGLSLIEDSCLNYRYCLPNKIFEYNMAGIPVVVSNLPEMKKVIEDTKIGLAVKENTVIGLLDTINTLVKLDKEELQLNIKKAKKIYNWEQQEKTLLSIYSKI